MRILTLILIATLMSCNSSTTKKSTTQTKTTLKNKTEIGVNVKHNKSSLITIGDDITFTYTVKKHLIPDSIKLSVNFKFYGIFAPNAPIIWKSKNESTGDKIVQLIFYWNDTLSTKKSINFRLLSDIEPINYAFKTINKWAHNTNSYTQGLEFSDGYLYEGTGNYGKSMLYKFDFDNNEIIQSVSLNSKVFGEGITILDDKIYQLTWRSNIGYVYNKSSLTKLYDFTYPTEGWGLTNNGTELIMSDGSEYIYFLDTEFLQETHRIQVFDNKKPIKNLNELEYIDELIYANIYGTNSIVAFEPTTGKVIKHINLTGIVDIKDIKTPIDVLNGIAWDKNNKRLVVTGKWWPYLYEIELIPL